ncbi:MAG: di-trans,poly-cis-decaprenylcistransferase [Deltaproteobacteria bacterium]|nr:MAG: di-trans,poly-cis-decaprenylcistransferase [Deltaproteobacteria bacterium]
MADRLPRHVAIIMDGNGRWARTRGLPRSEGHRAGAQSVRDVVRAARQIGIEALTLYAFSSQNWDRPVDEVQALMHLLRDYLIEERPEIMDNEIRLRAIGHVGRLPADVLEPLEALIADSAGNDKMTLTLALSYAGRDAIVDAARACVADGLAAAEITEETFGARLPTADLPPLDLLIRTSGEQRISNFLLWEVAYAELVFDDTLWPDFRRANLYRAIEEYARRERRFGKTGDQIAREATAPASSNGPREPSHER